jgi:predicted nucleic acid-binding protein
VVHPVSSTTLRARRLVGSDRMTARDAIHIAIMQRREIDRILTFDDDFDAVAGIERVRPQGRA